MSYEFTKLVNIVSVLLLRLFDVDRLLGLAMSEREFGKVTAETGMRGNDGFREVKVLGDVSLLARRLNLDGKTS